MNNDSAPDSAPIEKIIVPRPMPTLRPPPLNAHPDSATIPDSWPSPALQATIDEHHEFYAGRNVLITGAFGFVGGHLARALLAAGAHVTALDIDTSRTRGSQLNLNGLRDEMTIVEGDVTDRHAMREVVRAGRFEFIFHLAASATTVEKAMTDPFGTILANTMGFVHLAEAARAMPEDERPVLLYSSTDKVYGESDILPYVEEKTELKGVGVYDAAKLAADIFANTYHKALGLPTIVLRLCNLFGPYDFNYDYRLVPKAMRNIFRDHSAPELYFDSLQHFRDYLYVEDAARAFMCLAREPECRGHVFNLPGAHFSNTPDVLRDIVSMVSTMQEDARRNGSDSTLTNLLADLEWDQHIRLIQSDTNVVVISKQHLDGTRIKRFTGFEPSVQFRDGLRHTALFYLWYFTQSAKRQSDFTPIPERRIFEPVS